MKGSFGLLGAVALGLFITGCGDKSSDPDAVSVDELKYPGNLVIHDQGNGAAILSWSGANNEDDFDGYNVYGMINDPALGVTDGDALKLLDESGSPVDASKAILAKFNYGETDKLSKAAPAAEEGKLSALPIHRKDGEDLLLPTCKPAAGTCALTTKAALDDSVEDKPALATNGTVSFTVPDPMTVGKEYCFLVLSSMDKGEKVSQTSSNAACFTPAYEKAFALPLPDATNKDINLDLTGWLAACNTAGTCADPTTGTTKFVAANTTLTFPYTSQTNVVAAVEYSSTSGPAFVAGKNSAVIDLGYYEDGFADDNLPSKAPALVIDGDTYHVGSASGPEAPIFNDGGYSIAGQSVGLIANHMYVIAVGDPAATTAVSSFHYQWIYVKGAVTGTSVDVIARLQK